ncbi:hypothetical protein [Actinomadura napierensis]|uniref:hypothetical protein n=1 Tax=Actinomadura napierensis TaxID=267854 RepID=UPI0031D4EC46
MASGTGGTALLLAPDHAAQVDGVEHVGFPRHRHDARPGSTTASAFAAPMPNGSPSTMRPSI